MGCVCIKKREAGNKRHQRHQCHHLCSDAPTKTVRGGDGQLRAECHQRHRRHQGQKQHRDSTKAAPRQQPSLLPSVCWRAPARACASACVLEPFGTETRFYCPRSGVSTPASYIGPSKPRDPPKKCLPVRRRHTSRAGLGCQRAAIGQMGQGTGSDCNAGTSGRVFARVCVRVRVRVFTRPRASASLTGKEAANPGYPGKQPLSASTSNGMQLQMEVNAGGNLRADTHRPVAGEWERHGVHPGHKPAHFGDPLGERRMT